TPRPDCSAVPATARTMATPDRARVPAARSAYIFLGITPTLPSVIRDARAVEGLSHDGGPEGPEISSVYDHQRCSGPHKDPCRRRVEHDARARGHMALAGESDENLKTDAWQAPRGGI